MLVLKSLHKLMFDKSKIRNSNIWNNTQNNFIKSKYYFNTSTRMGP